MKLQPGLGAFHAIWPGATLECPGPEKDERKPLSYVTVIRLHGYELYTSYRSVHSSLILSVKRPAPEIIQVLLWMIQ